VGRRCSPSSPRPLSSLVFFPVAPVLLFLHAFVWTHGRRERARERERESERARERESERARERESERARDISGLESGVVGGRSSDRAQQTLVLSHPATSKQG